MPARLSTLGLLATVVVGAGCQPLFGLEAPIEIDADLRQHTGYVVDHVLLPRSNSEAQATGMDLDGDGVIENRLGMVFSTLSGMGLDCGASTQGLVDTGALIMLVDTYATSLVSADAEVSIVFGTNPVPAPCNSGEMICRHHLDGTATFDVSAIYAQHPPLLGSIDAAGRFVGGPGQFSVAVSIGGMVPVVLPLAGAYAVLEIHGQQVGSDTRPPTTLLAGGVLQREMGGVYAALADSFEPTIAGDCTDRANPPSCGCATASTGKTIIGLFDGTPRDCSVSASEISNNSLITSLFAPDLTIDGEPALSIGFGVSAVGATFTLD